MCGLLRTAATFYIMTYTWLSDFHLWQMIEGVKKNSIDFGEGEGEEEGEGFFG